MKTFINKWYFFLSRSIRHHYQWKQYHLMLQILVKRFWWFFKLVLVILTFKWFYSIKWNWIQWLDKYFSSIIIITVGELISSGVNQNRRAVIFFWRVYNFAFIVENWFENHESVLQKQDVEVTVHGWIDSVRPLLWYKNGSTNQILKDFFFSYKIYEVFEDQLVAFVWYNLSEKSFTCWWNS